MKTILLMVLFSSPEIPVPHQEPGFAPRHAANMQTCLERREFMNRYLSQILEPQTRFKVYCVEKTAQVQRRDEQNATGNARPI